jgi:DNA (cytosine-5)-methyltransferase 1
VGSLFAGIGGFDLGFERAGFKTIWQVEKNAYCRRVLRRHFPDADRRVTDVRFAGARNLLPVDVICGGFPCQDISNAGLRAGIDGARSGLWGHMHRIIGELRPRFVVVENVAALLGRGMGRVLGDLSEIGYDAEWQVISAADVGAPHLRERVWLVAHDTGLRCGQRRPGRPASGGSDWEGEWAQALADTESERCGEARELRCDQPSERIAWSGAPYTHPDIFPVEWSSVPRSQLRAWDAEPAVGRVVDGLSVALVAPELRALGNAVVPQIPELIARRLNGIPNSNTGQSN